MRALYDKHGKVVWVEGLGAPNPPADVDDWVPHWASLPETERLRRIAALCARSAKYPEAERLRIIAALTKERARTP
jgi:hypothetical protein